MLSFPFLARCYHFIKDKYAILEKADRKKYRFYWLQIKDKKYKKKRQEIIITVIILNPKLPSDLYAGGY